MKKKYTAKDFVTQIKREVRRGESSLSWLTNAYLWANKNLKSIHRYWPKYTQRWLKDEVKRVFNLDVEAYIRVARKIGGGTRSPQIREAFRFMDQIGAWECIRAERVLPTADLKDLIGACNNDTTPGAFRELVRQASFRLEIESPRVVAVKKPSKPTMARLIADNGALRIKVRKLTEENVNLRSRLQQITSLVGG